MNTLFKISGVIIIILSVIICAIYSYAGYIVLMAIITLVFGASLIYLGSLIERVSYLEEKLKMKLTYNNREKLPQKTCPVCSATHDFDYPNCPNCNYHYDM